VNGVVDLRRHDERVDRMSTPEAKRTGILACDFRIDSDGAVGTTLWVDGRLSVSGAFGGMAETTVRDQVIEPVFRDDLVRLLNVWSMQGG